MMIKPLLAEQQRHVLVRRGWQELNPCRPSQSDRTPLLDQLHHTYVLKDSHGGVVWKSPLVRRYATKCATILDIVTLDEFQSYTACSESDSASYKEHSNGSENKSIAADFFVIDSKNSVARASSSEISTGSVRWNQRHPSLMSFGDATSDLPVKTIYL